MRLIISTQYRENYGAHDWDGKGECPQYWKNKGGYEYVAAEMPDEAFEALQPGEVAQLFETAEAEVNRSDEYVQEHVINRSVVPTGTLTASEAYFEDLLAREIAEEADRGMYAPRQIAGTSDQGGT